MENEPVSFLCQYCGLIWKTDRSDYRIRDIKTDNHHWKEYSSNCPICERPTTSLIQLPDIESKFSLSKGLK